MGATAISGDAISDEEKRLALARVLESRTFSRSDQLRAFLRYVCEAELEGRAHQLNEYALGVSVLGRPEGYSPAEDSSVRSRAYELRNKLKSYYSDEAPDDPIQIEIEKGAYVPRFRRRATAEPRPPLGGRAGGERRRSAVGARRRASRWRSRLVAAVTASFWNLGAGFAFWRPGEAGRQRPGRAGVDARDGGAVDAVPRSQHAAADLLRGPHVSVRARDRAGGARLPGEQEGRDVAQSKALTAFRERMGADQLVETYDYADVGRRAGRLPPRAPLEPGGRPQARERPRLGGHLEQQRHLRRQVDGEPRHPAGAPRRRAGLRRQRIRRGRPEPPSARPARPRSTRTRPRTVQARSTASSACCRVRSPGTA